ncbi:MAG: winged helix-turn-helix transcriptional regulator [Phycisphaerales bacterium]|nr:winged helix-turn-helix transcriptional regulator [Phycisphaerales bacterium]
MMTQVTKHAGPKPPASPRHAARRRATVDKLLDPDLFKALADPTRLKLLACLIKCGRRCSVTEVAECCSVDFSVVARHLALLARAGILDAEKEGRTMWYAPRCPDLCARFRALADAIEVWCGSAECCDPNSDGGACGCR